MKTKIFVGLFVLVSSVAYSNGRTVNLPNDEFAIASITFPSSWRLSPVPNGMEGTSPDGAVYISVVAVGNSSGLVKDLKETQQILEKHKVTLDKSSQNENRFTVNGLPARELVYQGKDEDGRATVSFCKFDLGDKMIVTTYWVSTAQEKPHADEVRRIVPQLNRIKWHLRSPSRQSQGALVDVAFYPSNYPNRAEVERRSVTPRSEDNGCESHQNYAASPLVVCAIV